MLVDTLTEQLVKVSTVISYREHLFYSLILPEHSWVQRHDKEINEVRKVLNHGTATLEMVSGIISFICVFYITQSYSCE